MNKNESEEYGYICMGYGVDGCDKDKKCKLMSKGGKSICWSDAPKMKMEGYEEKHRKLCSLCPSHRDDDAMIIDDDKKYSCKTAAEYLQSPEGKRTCEADPGTVKSWWILCCPE